MPTSQLTDPVQSRQEKRRQARLLAREQRKNQRNEQQSPPLRTPEQARYFYRLRLQLNAKRTSRIRVLAIERKRDTAGEVGGDETTGASETSKKSGKKPELKSKDVTGMKYLELVAPLLERLHLDGCTRDTAGNRKLHYDQYCMLILLYLFNPTITSLRSIEQASALDKVKKKLGCSRASLASMSESAGVFDSQRLKAIIAELGAEAKVVGRHDKLKDIDKTITLVDGSLVSALPSILSASFFKKDSSTQLVKWRLHTHFEVDRYIPTRIDVTPDAGGDCDERAVMERTIEKDRLYVMDRGYAKFSLFNAIVKADSSYVCRLRDNSVYEIVETRELTDADRAAGVLSDQIVVLGKQTNKNRVKPDHRVRLICVKCSPHTSRSKYKGTTTGPDSDGILRIATNLMDVPAEIIALIYAQRWQIEIFFRFLKQFLSGSHLLSHRQNGIEIQAYCAIIACLLINLWTGSRPTKRTFEMICHYFSGLASEEELSAYFAKLKDREEKLRKKKLQEDREQQEAET